MAAGTAVTVGAETEVAGQMAAKTEMVEGTTVAVAATAAERRAGVAAMAKVAVVMVEGARAVVRAVVRAEVRAAVLVAVMVAAMAAAD